MKMTWIDYLGNKLAVDSVYSAAPSLVDVRLHEVRLHQDGPRVSLRLDLNDFPDNPPRKWVVGKFNRTQLTLVLIDISDFQMTGWSLNNIGDLTFDKCNVGIRVKFAGPSLRIECTARFIEVEKISGYCDSDAITRQTG
jgi:hypothetical protein